MADANDNFSEVEDPYEFAHRLLEQIDGHPKLKRKEHFPEFNAVARCVGQKLEKATQGEEQKITDQLREDGVTSECSASYYVEDTKAAFNLTASKVTPEKVLFGELDYTRPGPDPTIDNEKVAPEGTFLYRIRQTAMDIAEQNSTDYLTPVDMNSEPAVKGLWEPVYFMKIPVHYDDQLLDDTIDAIVTTGKGIGNRYQKALSNFSVETK